MKKQFKKFALPIGMGIMLLTITIMGLVSTIFVGCKKEQCGDKCCRCDGSLGTQSTCNSGLTCEQFFGTNGSSIAYKACAAWNTSTCP